ncbi:phage integrase central domain-containing protein [Orrella marina]|uniref:phage integrase central domain-containing protein n=1 Tax=Orrella marina TaxID=2163011 RepID=UPI0038995BFD
MFQRPPHRLAAATRWEQVWRRLELDAFPALGSIPADALTAAHVRDCVKAIEARGAIKAGGYCNDDRNHGDY